MTDKRSMWLKSFGGLFSGTTGIPGSVVTTYCVLGLELGFVDGVVSAVVASGFDVVASVVVSRVVTTVTTALVVVVGIAGVGLIKTVVTSTRVVGMAIVAVGVAVAFRLFTHLAQTDDGRTGATVLKGIGVG